jgi:hypothetical protein
MAEQYDFKVTKSLSLENSFGTIKQEEDIEIDVTVGINDEDSGWFELYDVETGGEDWYAEGGLEFDGMDIVGYDGVFELPDFIVNKLVELGYKDEL